MATGTTTENVGSLREFDPINSDWVIFKKRLINFFDANAISDNKRKKAILLNQFSEDGYKLITDLCLPDEPEKKEYDDLVTVFDNHFKSSDIVYAARYKFYRAEKSHNETPREWAARLRSLASKCNFEQGVLSIALRDIFVVGYEPGPVQDRIFEEKLTTDFTGVQDIAVSKCAVIKEKSNISIKREPEELLYVGNTAAPSVNQHQHRSEYPSKGNCSGRGNYQRTGFMSSTENRRLPLPRGSKVRFPPCTVCGRRNHDSTICAYRECFCHLCQQKGHLASQCKQKRPMQNMGAYPQHYLESEDKMKNASNIVLLLLTFMAVYSHYMVADKLERTAPALVFLFMLSGRLVVYFQLQRREEEQMEPTVNGMKQE